MEVACLRTVLLRRLVALALLLVWLCPSRVNAADLVWEAPVPVSPPPADGSYRFHDLLAVPGDGFRLLALLDARVARFSVRSQALTVDGRLDWETAWRERREFTFDNGTKQSAYEIHGAVDGHGTLHVVYEAFNLFGNASLDIGYKSSGAPGWAPDVRPTIVSRPGARDCMGANPGLCIGTAPDGTEWIHVLYHRRPLLGGDVGEECRPFVYVHVAKPAAVPGAADGWGPETPFTDAFREQEFQVAGEGGVGLMPVADGRGRIHAIGRRHAARTDSVEVCHVVGWPPDGPGGAWTTRATTLDSMPRFPGDDAHEPPVTSPLQCVHGAHEGREALDVVWNRNVVDPSGPCRREVWYARLDPAQDAWSAPVRLSEDDSASAHGGRLWRSRDGKLHLIYHFERAGGRIEMRYRRADGDPTDPGSWTSPEPLAHPGESVRGPVFVAEADTVWLGYTTEVAGAPPQRRWRAWFRKGYPATASASLPDVRPVTLARVPQPEGKRAE